MFGLAPWVLALVILPEFAQHVVEISLGMFDSPEAAHALAYDPARWAFGYAKVAGLLLCFLASARFWWTREHGGRWFDLRQIAWAKLLVGLLLFGVIGVLAEPFAGVLPALQLNVARVVFALLSLPFLFLMLAGIFGDRHDAINTATVARRAWRYIPLLLFLLLAAYGPAFYVHSLNHQWAIGAPLPLVWGLMIFDALTVGLLAGLTGTAMYLGYRRFRNRIPSAN
jgi:hypothetical protein